MGSVYPVQLLGMQHLDALLALDLLCYGGHWGRGGYQTEIERPSSRVLGAFSPDPERLVGFGILWMVLEEGHIISLAVHPDHRRRGIGEGLLSGLMAEARAAGGEWLTLEVREHNPAAIALYQKVGFREIGRRKQYYDDTLEDALIFWKKPI